MFRPPPAPKLYLIPNELCHPRIHPAPDLFHSFSIEKLYFPAIENLNFYILIPPYSYHFKLIVEAVTIRGKSVRNKKRKIVDQNQHCGLIAMHAAIIANLILKFIRTNIVIVCPVGNERIKRYRSKTMQWSSNNGDA